jgi:hypothetical protein
VSVVPFLSPLPFSFSPDRRLAQQTKLLKERNATLLRAVGSVKSGQGSSAVSAPASSEECVSPLITRILPFTRYQKSYQGCLPRLSGVADIFPAR